MFLEADGGLLSGGVSYSAAPEDVCGEGEDGDVFPGVHLEHVEEPSCGFAHDEGGGLLVDLDEFSLGLQLLVEEGQGLALICL